MKYEILNENFNKKVCEGLLLTRGRREMQVPRLLRSEDVYMTTE